MAEKNNLFPLKLVDFEHYMLLDDSAQFPMTIPVHMRLTGELNNSNLESALHTVATENPLISARARRKGKDFYWVKSEPPNVRWVAKLPEFERIDLINETGTKIYACQTEYGTDIRVFVHHSVADGLAVTEFVEQWLWEYAILEGDRVEPRSKPKAELLKCRGQFGMNFFEYLLRNIQIIAGYVGVVEYFSHRPVALGPQSYSDDFLESEQPQLGWYHVVIDRDESRRIIANAKRARFSVNDLFLGAFYDACYRWLAERYPHDADRHIRVMIPTNERHPKNHQTVANQVSMIFLDRKPGKAKSLRSTVWWIWLEMSAVKIMKLGLTFINLIKLMRFFGRLPRLLHRDRCAATSVLSNMGRVYTNSPILNSEMKLAAGNVVLESIHFYPPVRPFTWVASVTSTYAGTMQYNISYCKDAIPTEELKTLVGYFKENLLNGLDESRSDK